MNDDEIQLLVLKLTDLLRDLVLGVLAHQHDLLSKYPPDEARRMTSTAIENARLTGPVKERMERYEQLRANFQAEVGTLGIRTAADNLIQAVRGLSESI